MKASDYIARFLHTQGVTHVFELSGGMITHILDSLFEQKNIQIVTMHHEQSAAFAADGYARVTGVPGVALATSGPGATNLLTGIGSCYFDSVPAIFVTGQVNVHEQKGDRDIRQLGFQETDIVSMARPVTKAAFAVKTAAELPAILEDAFRIALGGRPGPVLIDVPMNVQREEVPEGTIEKQSASYNKCHTLDTDFWERFERYLHHSGKPLLLAGRGVMSAFARDQFRRFVELTQMPVVTSLLGIDTLPFDHPLRVGFIGAYGNRWANLTIGESDFMVVVGSRLDIRQTGADVRGFKGNRTIIHIDIEPGEINNRVLDCESLVVDVATFLESGIAYFSQRPQTGNRSWLDQINNLKEKWPDINEVINCKGINPNAFMHRLSKVSPAAGAYLADVGSHQMWAAQSLELRGEQFFFTSGGMGAMGFCLPAAIGASFALNRQPVVAIIGDGCMQLNIQELQTITRNKLPIKIVVLNNQSLGMIRQFQDSYFDSKYQSTVWGYSAPDFEKVARAYEIGSATVHTEAEIEMGLSQLWNDPDQPFLLQVMIDPFSNVYPKIAFGKPITEMEPFFKPIEMEGT